MKNVVAAVAAALVVVSAAVPAAAQDRRARREERRGSAQENRQDNRETRRDDVKQEAQAKKKTADPGANRRQRRQASRVAGGVRSGQLTADEVTSLSAHEAALRTVEANAKADGTLSDAERAQLQRELSSLSREIHAEKHDGDGDGANTLRTKSDVSTSKATASSARRLAVVRRELNATTPTPAQRSALEAEHAALVDALFEDADDAL